MTMELEGKVALVTGGTSGIGREVAKQLATLGAEVVVSGRDAARGAEAVAEIEAAGGTGRFVAADLADFAAIGNLAEEVGEVDVLVNNAGTFGFAPTPDESQKNLQAMFDVNVRAPYFLTAALARRWPAAAAARSSTSRRWSPSSAWRAAPPTPRPRRRSPP
jgi:NAD(P)-dependent dehydrogenase (short-subunit alcohol dehydrogenase family)